MVKEQINIGILDYNETSKQDLGNCDVVFRRNKYGNCIEVVKNIHGKCGIIKQQKKLFSARFKLYKLKIRFSVRLEK